MRPKHSTQWKLAAGLLPISMALYLASLKMDVATAVTTLTVFGSSTVTEEPYRLLSTIQKLYEAGETILVIAITAFTVLFPISKYVGLAYVLFGASATRRVKVTTWIKNLGQWSMGDVFVVALLVVILRINTMAMSLAVQVDSGLYVFGASVLSSMIVSVLVATDAAGKGD